MRTKAEKPIRPRSEILKIVGPRWAYSLLPLLMALVFFYAAWETYAYPRESYRKLYKVVFEALGNSGVVVLNLVFGFALLALAIVVQRHMKVVFKRIEGE